MKKLLIAFSALVLAAIAAAQQVWIPYTVTDIRQGVTVPAYISYRPNGGYEMVAGGQRAAVDITPSEAVLSIGRIIFKIPIDGKYWHGRPGMWRILPITTSTGDTGFHRMYYVGMEPAGRRYIEEFWLNGKLFSRGETLIDHNDHIVWSVMTDSEGTLRLARSGFAR